MQVEYLQYVDFPRSLSSLFKRGGKYQRAADEAYGVLGRSGHPGDPFVGIPLTNHGESRIRHCRKYDLTGFCRLITVHTDGYCLFLYCGTHAECEDWLEAHRGLEPSVDRATRVVTATYVSQPESGATVSGRQGHSPGPLYTRIPEELFERLCAGLPRRIMRSIEALDASVPEPDLWTIVGQIDDGAKMLAVRDVLALLRQDRAREAVERARHYLGEVVALDDLPTEQLPEVIDSDIIRRIPTDSGLYAEAMRRFVRSARYRDWMLFMHRDQEAHVAEDFNGPAKLVGVSGSGKTCVVVRRAVRLLRQYEGQKVLILTLNRALAQLIDQLVSACVDETERDRIEVTHLFKLMRTLVNEFEPRNDALYDEVTWKTNEHVDEVWQEYYRCETNNYDARVLQPAHDSLLSRGWNPERYLREEIDWLRSALPPRERAAYLDLRRVGRTVNFARSLREAVLGGASGWETKMRDIGVVDSLGLAQILTGYLSRLKPRFRAILIDEAQDFGNIELQIVRQLVAPAENDLFLCGDAAQAVTTKYQALKAAGIDIPGARSRKLALNYRNSRDVLLAAYHVLYANMTDEMMDREDFEILDPQYSSFSAATPLLLEAEDLEHELAYARAFVGEQLEGRLDGKACIAVCGYSLYELQKYGEELGLPVLDGRTDIDAGSVFLSDLEQTKGFEFDVVCVVNCREGTFPSRAAPDSERFRDLARLYVAMTRAKTDLVVSWSRRRSPFFANVTDQFLAAPWSEYAPSSSFDALTAPRRLETHRPYGLHRKSWADMNGEEFLYTDAALGLTVELISKIRELVDGVGLSRGRERVRWRNLGSASADYRKEPKARRLWGPEVGKQFVVLVEQLQAARRLRRASQNDVPVKDIL